MKSVYFQSALFREGQIRTLRMERRVPIRAKKLKKRVGGQFFEVGEA